MLTVGTTTGFTVIVIVSDFANNIPPSAVSIIVHEILSLLLIVVGRKVLELVPAGTPFTFQRYSNV
jgi:hypothetical protein